MMGMGTKEALAENQIAAKLQAKIAALKAANARTVALQAAREQNLAAVAKAASALQPHVTLSAKRATQKPVFRTYGMTRRPHAIAHGGQAGRILAATEARRLARNLARVQAKAQSVRESKMASRKVHNSLPNVPVEVGVIRKGQKLPAGAHLLAASIGQKLTHRGKWVWKGPGQPHGAPPSMKVAAGAGIASLEGEEGDADAGAPAEESDAQAEEDDIEEAVAEDEEAPAEEAPAEEEPAEEEPAEEEPAEEGAGTGMPARAGAEEAEAEPTVTPAPAPLVGDTGLTEAELRAYAEAEKARGKNQLSQAKAARKAEWVKLEDARDLIKRGWAKHDAADKLLESAAAHEANSTALQVASEKEFALAKAEDSTIIADKLGQIAEKFDEEAAAKHTMYDEAMEGAADLELPTPAEEGAEEGAAEGAEEGEEGEAGEEDAAGEASGEEGESAEEPAAEEPADEEPADEEPAAEEPAEETA